MATEIRTGIRLTGDASGMNAAFSSGQKSVKNLNTEVSEASKGAKGLTGDLGALGGGLTKVASAIAGWQMGRVIISTADDMTVLKSRLKLVTDNSTDLAYVQQRLFGIAQQSRVSYSELGATYAQIARAAGDLGVSQERMLGVTQTIGQAMAISGGSAESMKAALVQLSQGLASGTLRGEELNSVMEQTPRLAQAIAQGMGVSLGQLRALGQDGKLTALSVVEALEKAAPALKREFDQVTPTISGSFTTLKNSASLFIAQLDKATDSSGGLSRLLMELSRGADEFTSRLARMGQENDAAAKSFDTVKIAGEGIKTVLETIVVLGANVAYVLKQTGMEVGGLAAQGAAVLRGDLTGAANIRKSMLEDAASARAGIDRFSAGALGKRSVGDGGQSAKEAFRSAERSDLNRTEAAAMFPGAKPLEEVRKYSKLAVDVQREAYDQSVDIAKSYQNRIKLATNDPDRLALTREMNARLIQVDKDAKKELKSIAEQGAAEAKQLAEAQFGLKKADLEKGAALDRADLDQKQRTNEQLYKLGLLDVDEYYQRRADLGLADIAISTRLVEAELAQARALAASSQRAEDKAQAQARVLGLEKELIELGAKRTATAAEPDDQRVQRRKDEQDRIDNEASAARRAANARAYDDAKQLELDIKALRIGFIRDPQLQAKFQLADDLQTRRDRMLDGVTSPDARQLAMDRFNEYAAAKSYELSERMKPGWQRMVESWQDTTMLMRDTFAETMEGMVRNGEDAFIQWAKTGKASAKSLVDVVITEMARMTYRQNIASPLTSLLSTGLSYLFAGVDSSALPTGDFSRMDRLQQRASGGSYGPGLVLRGEAGPELTWENTGGYVFTAEQTRAILMGSKDGRDDELPVETSRRQIADKGKTSMSRSSLGRAVGEFQFDRSMLRQFPPGLDQLQQRASGGTYGPGLVLRGEAGPELSWENTGGYVFNASQTREILAGAGAAGSGAQSVTVNVINQNGSQVDVKQRQTGSGLQIDVLITQLQDAMADNLSVGSGNLARALEGRYGLRTAVA